MENQKLLQNIQIPFKQRYSIQERRQKYLRTKQHNTASIPIILEKHPSSKLPFISKRQFCAQKQYSTHAFGALLNQIVRRKLQYNYSQTNEISFYVNNNNICEFEQDTLQNIYQKYKQEDGFLYLMYGQYSNLHQNFLKKYFFVILALVIICMGILIIY